MQFMKIPIIVAGIAVMSSVASARADVSEQVRGVLVPLNELSFEKLLPKPEEAAPLETLGPKPEPTLPPEWRNFTPTDTQNPSTNFVGTLLIKDPDGKFSSTSQADLLQEKACKAPVVIDNTKDDVYTDIQKIETSGGFDLGFIKIGVQKGQALKLMLSRIASVMPTTGFDYKAVEAAKRDLDVAKNKDTYWVCLAQEVFAVTYQTFEKKKVGGAGTYNLVSINGEVLAEAEKMKKFYNFRLKTVPLERFWLPAPSPSPGTVSSPSPSPSPTATNTSTPRPSP
jgi:hypothetical protein